MTPATQEAKPGGKLSDPARVWLVVVGLLCGYYGVCAFTIYAISFSTKGWQDWMVYYSAARAYLDGNLPLIFDGARFTAQMNRDFAAWLPQPLSFHPWLYPPPFLLLLVPFGLLSFVAAGAVFLAATFAGLLAAVWCVSGAGYRRWLHAFSLLFAPAVWFNVGTGQNGFLTGALLVGGFGLLRRRPRLAGALLGLLAYKPQLWLLAPVALVAARQWRALASAIAAALVMALVSVAVFGIEPWRAWLGWFIDPPAEIYQTWLKWGRLHGESVYTNLVLIGASHGAATAGQTIVTLIAGACVWWCWRRPMPDDLRLVVLLAATVLAAPHVTNYDTVVLVVAATLAFVRGLDTGFRRGEVIVPLLVWMIQLFNPPDAYWIGRITPLLTALLIACAIRRWRAEAGATQPATIARSVPNALPSSP